MDVLLQLEVQPVVSLVHVKQVPAGAAMGAVHLDPGPSAAIVADITGRHIQRNNHVVLLQQITDDIDFEILQPRTPQQPAPYTKNFSYNCNGLFTTNSTSGHWDILQNQQRSSLGYVNSRPRNVDSTAAAFLKLPLYVGSAVVWTGQP